MSAAIFSPGSKPVGRRPVHRTVLLAIGGSVALIGLNLWTSRPLILFNTTPSEPTGVYLEIHGTPTPGQIVAFRAPPAAFPYADLHLSYLHRVPMLKAVAAGAGDEVCTRSGRLRINGRDLAGIAETDSRGSPLPHWSGCRRMGPDQLFVFSGRVPNSFDSRYFGPVPRQAVMGVFRRLPLILGAR